MYMNRLMTSCAARSGSPVVLSLLMLASVLLTACGGGGGGGGGDSSSGGGGGGGGTTVYYVSASATDDSGDGLTPAAAKQTIQAAIDAAFLNTPAEVRVNAGTWTVNSTPGVDTHVKLRRGVALIGGYSADFSTRDPSTNTTTITDIGTGGAPNRAVEDYINMTSSDVLDGFTINASTVTNATESYAVFFRVNGSAVIRNCNIHGGGSNSGPITSAGIYVANSSPTIEFNTIFGGRLLGNSFGIMNNTGSTVIIRNNTIDGGIGQTAAGILNTDATLVTVHDNIIKGATFSLSSYGVDNNNSNLVMYKNTVSGGSGNSTHGIRSYLGSTALVTNNIIFGGSGGTSYIIKSGSNFGNTANSVVMRNNTTYLTSLGTFTYGVQLYSGSIEFENNIISSDAPVTGWGLYEVTANTDFTTVSNNVIYNLSVPYFDFDGNCSGNADGDNDAQTCTLAEMEALADISSGASNNVSTDPMFADIDGADNDIFTFDNNDLHLTGSTPSAVTQGGLNGIDNGWSITADFDDVTRPVSGSPWAIGAYEP